MSVREEDVLAALAKRYGASEWTLLTQVGNATGGRANRWADALAMNLWPSRGLHLYGFEIKVSRSDWLRELKRPDKAETIASYCHAWWIVAGEPGIVRLDEVPGSWGLMELRGRGLVAVRPAPMLDHPKEMDRAFVASILRRSTQSMIPRASVQDVIDSARKEGEKAGEYNRDAMIKTIRGQYERMSQSLEAFEKASGVKIDYYEAGRQGEAVRLAMALGRAGIASAIEEAQRRLERTLEMLRKASADEAAANLAQGDA